MTDRSLRNVADVCPVEGTLVAAAGRQAQFLALGNGIVPLCDRDLVAVDGGSALLIFMRMFKLRSTSVDVSCVDVTGEGWCGECGVVWLYGSGPEANTSRR